MSLVGPRPALPHEVAQFDPEFLRRHGVKPGITGLWQLEARDNPSFHAYRRLDLLYVDNWSIGLDLFILLVTVPMVIAARRQRLPTRAEAARGIIRRLSARPTFRGPLLPNRRGMPVPHSAVLRVPRWHLEGTARGPDSFDRDDMVRDSVVGAAPTDGRCVPNRSARSDGTDNGEQRCLVATEQDGSGDGSQRWRRLDAGHGTQAKPAVTTELIQVVSRPAPVRVRRG